MKTYWDGTITSLLIIAKKARAEKMNLDVIYTSEGRWYATEGHVLLEVFFSNGPIVPAGVMSMKDARLAWTGAPFFYSKNQSASAIVGVKHWITRHLYVQVPWADEVISEQYRIFGRSAVSEEYVPPRERVLSVLAPDEKDVSGMPVVFEGKNWLWYVAPHRPCID